MSQSDIEDAERALAEGKTEKATQLWAQILDARTREAQTANAEAAHNLGALVFRHDTQAVLGCYERAIELDPDDPDGWNRLGHSLSPAPDRARTRE